MFITISEFRGPPKQILSLLIILKKKHPPKKQIKKTKLSLQLFLMANFDRVNGPIDMRVGKDVDLRIS